jgi:putative flippase GtrA
MKLSASVIRFGLTGIVTTLLHVGIASLLHERCGANAGLSNTIAFMASNLLSYVLNAMWSFRQPMTVPTWRRFVGVSLVAASMTFLIAQVIELAGGNFYLGIAAVVLTVPALSYHLHRRYTFRP